MGKIKKFLSLSGVLVLTFSLFALLIAVENQQQTTSQAAVTGTPTVVQENVVSTEASSKFPDIATSGQQVHLSWGETNSAKLAERPDESGAFTTSNMGSVGDNSSYFNTSVAPSPDGSHHYVWIHYTEPPEISTVHYRKRLPGQGWSGDRVIATGDKVFANMISVISNGPTVVAVWREEPAKIRFIYSNDGGGTWIGPGLVPQSAGAFSGIPKMTLAPGGAINLVWSNGTQILRGQWAGTTFNVSTVFNGVDIFNPTIAFDTNNKGYVAWRTDGDVRAIYLAEQNGATWNVIQTFNDSSAGPVVVATDSKSNVHLAWDSRTAVKYTARAPGGTFSPPIIVSVSDGSHLKTNIDMAVNAKTGYALAHIAWESHVTSTAVNLRYARIRISEDGTVPPTTAPPTPTTAIPPTATNAPTATTIPSPTLDPNIPTATPRPTKPPFTTIEVTQVPTVILSPTLTPSPTPIVYEAERFENAQLWAIILIIGGITFAVWHMLF